MLQSWIDGNDQGLVAATAKWQAVLCIGGRIDGGGGSEQYLGRELMNREAFGPVFSAFFSQT
jgi:hypothetical protein